MCVCVCVCMRMRVRACVWGLQEHSVEDMHRMWGGGERGGGEAEVISPFDDKIM